MNYLILLLGMCFSLTALGQLNLKPSIGLTSLPADNEAICNPNIPEAITANDNSFNNIGIVVGQTIPHFKLYKINGDSLDIETELLKGKPVVLISSSYTCPVYRGKVNSINNLVAQFGNKISFFIIYTPEAHPKTDISPYFGYIATNQININEGILYRQETTYGQRKTTVSEMLTAMPNTNAPVLLDGPCNKWWTTFGPAPNMAYLITTEGTVYAKHGWFDKAPQFNMKNDINSLLLTDIQNIISTNGVKVYPNPFNEIVTFSLPNTTDNHTITITDALGRAVKQTSELTINRENLPNGLYFYTIHSDNQLIHQGKLITN